MPTFAQGNEQWLPVANGDGTYSFYNLSSILALDNPAGSAAPGAQFDQSFGNGTKGQAFQLIQRAAASSDDAGAPRDGGRAGGTFDDGGAASDAPSPGSDADPSGTRSEASTGEGQNEASGSASGCGCEAAGAAPAIEFSGGLAFFALASLGRFRRKSSTNGVPKRRS